MYKLTSQEKAYFAGFFDGEGCIGLYYLKTKDGHRFRLVCVIGQKNHRILHLLKRTFGGSLSKPDKIWNVRQWQLWNKQAETFLCTILPYLKGKKKVAILALKYRKLVSKPRKGHFTDPKVKVKMLKISKEIMRLNQLD